MALVVLCFGCAPNPELGEASYSTDTTQVHCEPGTHIGPADLTNHESTQGGIKYTVRTPLNYNPTISHPLLMVYAPARRSGMGMERFTKLTLEATTAGFVVAYADNRPLSPAAITELSTIPGLVAQKWCIDKERIFLTGHSDGGSVSMGMAFMPETQDVPAAIAPSAAGITQHDLSEYECPDPIPVMVMHSANDRLFPGYGVGAVQWWAACNGCDLQAPDTMDNGCVAYLRCANGVQTWYCEGEFSHAKEV